MNDEIKLNDIAEDLLIINKMTIDTLFRLDNCSDCIALYVFYYKTAKWQKTNTIKANDIYVKKSLKWGSDKIRKTKATLKENGLIDIIQRRNNGKIEGWYIQVSYLVSKRKIEDVDIKVENSNNTQKQQHPKATSGNEETNALKDKIKCLEKEIKMLKNNNNNIIMSEAKAPDTYIIDLPTNRFNTIEENYYVTDEFYNNLCSLYENVNVMSELKKMKAWLITNKTRRKTLNGMEKFINGWLSRCQNDNKVGIAKQKNDGWEYINSEFKKIKEERMPF